MNNSTFNESEWIKLIFLLADTQQWLDELNQQAFNQLPVDNKKKLFRKTYHLGIKVMAHILERHYYKIPRHPGTGKFNIPITEILQHLRDAGNSPTQPVPGTLNHQRIITTKQPVGFDRSGESSRRLSILTYPGGEIITVFPGVIVAVSVSAAL